MRWCNIWIPATLLAALLLGAAWVWATMPPALRAYDRLRLGMTLPEVEGALGAEPRRPICLLQGLGICVRESGNSEIESCLDRYLVECWTWDGYILWVAFDQDGKAVRYCLCTTRTSALDFLHRFFGLSPAPRASASPAPCSPTRLLFTPAPTALESRPPGVYDPRTFGRPGVGS